MKFENTDDNSNDKLDNNKVEDKENNSERSDNEEVEKENQPKNNDNSTENLIEDNLDENVKFEVKTDVSDQTLEMDINTNVSIEDSKDLIADCSESNTDFEADTTTVENESCSKVIDNDNSEKPIDSKEECEKIKFEDDGVNTEKFLSKNDVLECSNNNRSDVVELCTDSTEQKLFESENLEIPQKPSENDEVLHQSEVQIFKNVDLIDSKQNENVQNNYDKTNPIQSETRQYDDHVLLNKFKGDCVENDIRVFNNPTACNIVSKPELPALPALPVSSVCEKQYDNTLITNEYCKPSQDPVMLLPTMKQYGNISSNEYCKTDTVQPNAKQYSEALLNEYRKLDMLQPEVNKQMYNKQEPVEYNKNPQVLPVSINNSQEVFKVAEQSKPKVTEKNYSHPVVTNNTITVPKYDIIKHEKQSKRTTPSPKTLPYRLPAEVPQVDKSRLHDYLPPPMGFVNYQKINNSIGMTHTDMPKATKDMYLDKKTDSVNMNLPKDKDIMNLPKSLDNSLLYPSVMQQSPYTDQSMMHLSLHHHLTHSTPYHHSPSVAPQVPPPPVHQTKSRSKKGEQRRLAQQNQTPVAPSTQQVTPPTLPSHTQSYHHHQTATYMMTQPSPSSPYHHSVIQHRMGQQSGSCSSADFYLSHSNQHAAACNLSKLQQMTNGLDHHRRHIPSPASSPASSPANMTTPPPAASAAAAHLLQQSAVAYHKLYQQAGQTNQSRQYGHQSRGSPASPNVGLMSMQYGAPPPPFNGYRVAPQSTPPPTASYMNQTTGQLQYSTHSQDPHHQNSVYPASAYNGSYLQPLNGSMHR